MPDLITVTGLVATTPKNVVTGTGLAVTTFRLASNQRRYDKTQQKWVDGDTNWFTVTSFRQLAANVVVSLQKGQRIVVTGRLRVRDWSSDDKKGTSVEIDAEAIGHDLTWGTAAFTRSAAAAVAEAEAAPAAEAEAAPSLEGGPAEMPPAETPPVDADAEAQPVEVATPF
jgi:single-strand DNA-binding protein